MASTDFRIRSMERGDLVQAGVLAGKLLRLHHGWDPLRFLKPENPEVGYTRWFGTQLDKDETILLVAEDADGIAGYVFAAMEERDWNALLDACTHLHDILVDERARGRGIGEALIEELFVRAAAKGAPRVVLSTATQNEGAQRLFKRCGFRTTMLEMTAELPAVSQINPQQK